MHVPRWRRTQIHTPLATIRLVEPEVAVMRDLHQRCCPPGSTSQFCTKVGDLGLGAAVAGASIRNLVGFSP